MQLRAPEPADAVAVLDLIIARDIADLGRPDYTLEDVQADWAAPSIDLARDAWIAEEDGIAVGYAMLDDRGAALITVPPASEGRGVGTLLREAAETRAVERGEALVRQFVPTSNEGARAQLMEAGYWPAYSYFRMRMDLADAPPAPPDVPVRTFSRGPGRRAGPRAGRGGDVRRARQRAALARVLAGRQGRQGGLGPVALAAARGRRRARRRRAVRALGGRRRLRRLPRGRPALRGQGLGRAMLLHGLAALRDAGLTVAELSVQGENASATRLYESVGMRPVWAIERWEKTLRAALALHHPLRVTRDPPFWRMMRAIMSAPIVVGFDPHSADDAPLTFGLEAARFTGAPLIVAAVYGGSLGVHRHLDAELEKELGADASAALDRLRARIEGEDVEGEVRLVEATSAARGLTVALEDEGAGLGVVGATGRGAVGRAVVGSTAERVIHGAPCPVAVVPHGFEGGEIGAVGVAYTRSDEGEQALRSGAALAQAAGAKLRVITVLHESQGAVVVPHGSDVGRAGLIEEQTAAQHRVEVEQNVAAAIEQVGGAVKSEIDLVYGDPADTLLGFTSTLDVLVMGSRAYGPQRAVLLGGVSRKVIVRSACPVLVLPRGAEHPLRELLASRQAA